MQDKKKYWFKRRRYGYGWTPASWQGWTLLGAWLIFILSSVALIWDEPDDEMTTAVWIFLGIVLFTTIILIALSYIMGPKPKWRWGKSADDDPDLDL